MAPATTIAGPCYGMRSPIPDGWPGLAVLGEDLVPVKASWYLWGEGMLAGEDWFRLDGGGPVPHGTCILICDGPACVTWTRDMP